MLDVPVAPFAKSLTKASTSRTLRPFATTASSPDGPAKSAIAPVISSDVPSASRVARLISIPTPDGTTSTVPRSVRPPLTIATLCSATVSIEPIWTGAAPPAPGSAGALANANGGSGSSIVAPSSCTAACSIRRDSSARRSAPRCRVVTEMRAGWPIATSRRLTVIRGKMDACTRPIVTGWPSARVSCASSAVRAPSPVSTARAQKNSTPPAARISAASTSNRRFHVMAVRRL